MILLIEAQCKNWEHNRVNYGIIKQIKSAFPNEGIKLYAENQHIINLTKLLEHDQIEIDSENIEFYDWRKENQDCKDEYENLLECILSENHDAREVMLLSCNKGIILACDAMSRNHINVTFHLFLHSATEEIYYQKKKQLKDKVWYFLSSIKHLRFQSKPVISMKECMEKCREKNCKFIIYSPNYEWALKGKLDIEILDKILFLHHPLFESNLNKIKLQLNNIIVGIYGQAVNQNALLIVKNYNSRYDNKTVVFKVMANSDNEILLQKNVERLFDKDYVTNEELEQAIKGFDFILIPYDNNQYIVTASGIFSDAISQEIPLLMLNSPYLQYYNKYEVGILCKDIDAMAKKISELHMFQDFNCFAENDKNLKQIVFEENVRSLKEALKL